MHTKAAMANMALQKGLLILVVEDEDIIRELLCEVLESEGFLTRSMESADLALDFLHQESAAVALILTDINMPGDKDGADLVNIALRAWPPIPVVVMSGVETLQSAGIGHAAWFVRKPFANHDMVTCIRNALVVRQSR
ncbi:response regulator [Xanthomonas sp. WHRI 1810A]|uniref:response regulator n=1 Tax=Xanthomonas sp. WHRI 1810A TaxID=3161565 RepID=UPI0032E8C125